MIQVFGDDRTKRVRVGAQTCIRKTSLRVGWRSLLFCCDTMFLFSPCWACPVTQAIRAIIDLYI